MGNPKTNARIAPIAPQPIGSSVLRQLIKRAGNISREKQKKRQPRRIAGP